MSIPNWLADVSANKFTRTYLKDYLDISGNLYIRNGKIQTPMNKIEFNDTTGYININNLYLFSNLLIYNPTTLSNIDLVAYVNNNNTNITSINSSITTANTNIATNTSSINTNTTNISTNTSDIATINSKVGTLGWDSIYDFTTVNNLFINPGGTIQYEDSNGNHPDLIPQVITNTSNITSNTSSISTINTKLTEVSWATGSPNNITTINNKLQTSVLAFSSTLNGVSSTTFGYISTLSANAQTALDSKCSLSGNQTIAGIKTFSSPPVMSGASITSNTIPLASIVGSVCDLASAQTLSGIKTFSAVPVFSSNLRLDGSLLLNAGALTLTNANLQKIQYLSTVSSDIQVQTTSNSSSITTLNTKTTAISYASSITTIASTTAMTNATLTGSLTINGGLTTYTNAQLLKINNILTSTSDLQTQINNFNGVGLNGNNTYTGVQTYNGNVVFNALLNNVSSTTFSYLDATSSIQSQLNNKGGLSTNNNWTNGNTFKNQLTGDYNAGSALTGSGTEFFFTGQRPWANGTPANGDNVYELSFDTGFYNRGLTIQGGCKNTLSGTGMKSCFGLYYRQYVTGGTDPTRNAIMYGEDSETGVINNTLVIPSSLRLDGSLKVGSSGGTTITNTQLGYLSTLSANVQSSINSLATKLTDITWTSGSPNKTTIVNTCETSTLTCSSLNGISNTVINYISGLTSDLATTLTSLSSSITAVSNKSPVGMIIQHPKGTLGSPYLLANGQAVSRTTYSALFASYGTLYGVGDGSTTFNLPNFQSQFLRCYGQGQSFGGTTYSTSAVGVVVNDSIIGHQHSGQSGSYLISTLTTTSTNGVAAIAVQKYNTANFTNTGGVVNGGGAETAPLHTCIYYYVLAL